MTTTMLNLIFNEAEKIGKSHNFRTYIGPGSNCSSTDKLSFDFHRDPERSASLHSTTYKKIGVQSRRACGLSEQVQLSTVTLLDCWPSVFSTQRRTELLTKSVHFMRKIIRQRPMFFMRLVQKQVCDVEQETGRRTKHPTSKR